MEPGPGHPALVQTDQRDSDLLPEDSGYQGVLDLDDLSVGVEQVGGLDQSEADPGCGDVGEAAAEVWHDVVLQLLPGGAPVASHVRPV